MPSLHVQKYFLIKIYNNVSACIANTCLALYVKTKLANLCYNTVSNACLLFIDPGHAQVLTRITIQVSGSSGFDS